MCISCEGTAMRGWPVKPRRKRQTTTTLYLWRVGGSCLCNFSLGPYAAYRMLVGDIMPLQMDGRHARLCLH